MPITSPDSTTIQLPRAVRERSARIAALLEAQRNPAPTPPADAPNPAPASPAPPIAVAAPTTPDPNASTASGLPPGDPRENDAGYWRQRAKAVFGMFERSREDVRGLREQIRELREQLRTKEASAPAETPVDLESLFSADERQQYGDEQLKLIARVANKLGTRGVEEAVTRATQPLKDRIEGDKESEAQRKWDQFTTALVTLCPDALDIDKTPEWGVWLQTVDEASGVTYFQQLKAHEGRYDAASVARLFNRYKADAGLGTAPNPAPPAAAPAPKPPVAPRSGGGHGSGELPQAQVLSAPSKAEIRDFYKRASLNKVTPAEREAFEARLAGQPA
jgi:hypothetical protein